MIFLSLPCWRRFIHSLLVSYNHLDIVDGSSHLPLGHCALGVSQLIVQLSTIYKNKVVAGLIKKCEVKSKYLLWSFISDGYC